MNAIEKLQLKLRDFADERDWAQFHSPKNLSMALSVEAAELLEHFQWLSEEESQTLSKDKLDQVKEEIADILLYLLRIADKLDIDLIEAAESKLGINGEKYPADKVKGSARKYSEYKE